MVRYALPFRRFAPSSGGCHRPQPSARRCIDAIFIDSLARQNVSNGFGYRFYFIADRIELVSDVGLNPLPILGRRQNEVLLGDVLRVAAVRRQLPRRGTHGPADGGTRPTGLGQGPGHVALGPFPGEEAQGGEELGISLDAILDQNFGRVQNLLGLGPYGSPPLAVRDVVEDLGCVLVLPHSTFPVRSLGSGGRRRPFHRPCPSLQQVLHSLLCPQVEFLLEHLSKYSGVDIAERFCSGGCGTSAGIGSILAGRVQRRRS